MGTKRVGLARTQALIENLKRELTLGGSTLAGVKRKTSNITESTTVTATDSGTVYFVDSAGATVITLPTSAAAGAGWWIRVVLTDEPTTSVAVTANTNELAGLVVAADGLDQSDANTTYTIDNSGNIGDWLEITCNGSLMYIQGNIEAIADGAFS